MHAQVWPRQEGLLPGLLSLYATSSTTVSIFRTFKKSDLALNGRQRSKSLNRRVEAGRAFQDALREVLTANAELLVLWRKQQPPR